MVEKDMVTMLLEKRRSSRRSITRRQRNVSKSAPHEPARRTVPNERNPWLTPTKFCESDETEDEGSAPFRAPPGLPDNLIEEKDDPRGCWVPDRCNREGGESSAPEVQADEGCEAVRGDHHRQEQQRAEWPETKSILSWNAGPKRGEVTSSMVRSFHVIMVQEAQTHYHEITTIAEHLFHIYQGAGQLILYDKNTFEPEGVKIYEEIEGTSM